MGHVMKFGLPSPQKQTNKQTLEASQNTLYELSAASAARPAAQCQESPGSGIVLVTHCCMTNSPKTQRPGTTDIYYFTVSVGQKPRCGSAGCLWLKVAVWSRLKGWCQTVTEGGVCSQAHSSRAPHGSGAGLIPGCVTQGRVRHTLDERHPRQSHILLQPSQSDISSLLSSSL